MTTACYVDCSAPTTDLTQTPPAALHTQTMVPLQHAVPLAFPGADLLEPVIAVIAIAVGFALWGSSRHRHTTNHYRKK